MSKALKKLKEENPPKSNDKVTEFLLRKTPEELERKAEEARRKEELAKRELEKAKSGIVESSLKLLKGMLKDEQEAPQAYRDIAAGLEILDEPVFADNIRRIASDEELHYAVIKNIVASLEERLKRK